MARLLQRIAQDMRQTQIDRPNARCCQLRRMLRVNDQRLRDEAAVCKGAGAVMMRMMARAGSTNSHWEPAAKTAHRHMVDYCTANEGVEVKVSRIYSIRGHAERRSRGVVRAAKSSTSAECVIIRA
jgi:hypothetical protein